MARLMLVGLVLGRALRVASVGLIASAGLALLAPGLVSADKGDMPNSPYGLSASIPSGLYGASQATATVTWHRPDTGVMPDTYWVKTVLAATGAWQSCYTYAPDVPTPSCTLTDPLTTGQLYNIYVYAGAWQPVVYGPPSEVDFTPIAPPGPVRLAAAQTVSYDGVEASVAVSWIPPASTGGGGVDEYRVGTLGAVSCTTSTLTCVLNPMGAGLSDTITIWAHNAGGWGAPSAFSYKVPAQATPTPTSPPAQPVPTASPAPSQSTGAPPSPGSSGKASPGPAAATAVRLDTATAPPPLVPVASQGAGTTGSLGPGAGSSPTGGPPWWLLLIAAVLLGAFLVAALLALRYRRARPQAG